ncbi:hypothetical protein DL96DRAFT_1565110 [Flagelloscypha sp. PMI_526]|nr:hypothetical protein DL96DRAFT_1565110 [Flagelloscypha sp. PMI_526]
MTFSLPCALAESRPKPDEKAVYHLHGGDFAYCSAHPSDTTTGISCSLLQLHAQNIIRSCSVKYHLAPTKPFDVVHPFPTALIDWLSGYYYLVYDVGYREENIIVVGDSAGGNLTLALNRYLRPHGDGTAVFNEYVYPVSLLLGVRSKVVGSYSGWPVACLAARGAELLFDEIRTLEEYMENVMGQDLLYIKKNDASHGRLLWELHEPESSETLADNEKWLAAL